MGYLASGRAGARKAVATPADLFYLSK